MTVPGGRRAVLLCAAAALTAGATHALLPAGAHDAATTDVARAAESRDAPLSNGAGLRAPNWTWSLSVDGAGTIRVRSHRCPKSHPRRIGSYSYRSVRITGAKVENHSSTGSVCAK